MATEGAEGARGENLQRRLEKKKRVETKEQLPPLVCSKQVVEFSGLEGIFIDGGQLAFNSSGVDILFDFDERPIREELGRMIRGEGSVLFQTAFGLSEKKGVLSRLLTAEGNLGFKVGGGQNIFAIRLFICHRRWI